MTCSVDYTVVKRTPEIRAEPSAVISWIMAGGIRKRFYLSSGKGGGIIRREVWFDNRARVVRYSLAYINHVIYAGDNGRVLGYDSAHGHHHRHYLGVVTTVRFDSFKAIEARFQREWSRIAKEARRAQD